MVRLAHRSTLDQQLGVLRESLNAILKETEKLEFPQMVKVFDELSQTMKAAMEKAMVVGPLKAREYAQKQIDETFEEYVERKGEVVIERMLAKYLEDGTLAVVSTPTSAPIRSEDGATGALKRSSRMSKETSDQVSPFSDDARKALSEAAVSQKKSLKFLMDAGIVEPGGKLNAKYRSPDQKDDPKGPQ